MFYSKIVTKNKVPFSKRVKENWHSERNAGKQHILSRHKRIPYQYPDKPEGKNFTDCP